MRRHQQAFTIIELVITLAVLGVLVMLAIPSMGRWIANSKVRTVADALQNDLRTIQAEAISHSRQTIFVLTAATPSGTASVTPSTSGKNWIGDRLPLTSGASTDTITYFLGNAIASQYGVSVAAKISSTSISVLCFNSTGRLTANSSTGLGAACTIPSGTSLVTFDLSLSGSDRPLRVEVQQGGRVRLCDPAKTLSTDQPDGCTSS